MKLNPVWWMIAILLIVIALLVFAIDMRSDCEKACQNSHPSGSCVSMQSDETCEDKFDMVSLGSDLCVQKTPDGFFRNCCCDKK